MGTLEAVVPVQLVTGRVGCRSLNVMFDLYLDEQSNNATAFSASIFDAVIRKEIVASGMTLRKYFIDAWESETEGPASLFYSLEESHVRIETWPAERHVQGEVQLCNFSKDNEGAAQGLANCIIAVLNPVLWEKLLIHRGPGTAFHVREFEERRS